MSEVGEVSEVKAVVFDIGNVLIEWDRDRLFAPLIPDDERRRSFYADVLTMEVNLALDAGAPYDKTLAELAGRHPEFASEIRAFDDRWGETLGPHDTEMVQLLGELGARDVGVYALTNFSAEKWPIALANHAWLADFDGVVVSGHERMLKPDAAIFEVLLSRYGLVSHTTWFTDDSPRNVEGALAVGMRASLFIDAATTRAELATMGLIDQ